MHARDDMRLLRVTSDIRIDGHLRWDHDGDARTSDGQRIDLLVVQGDLELGGDLVNRKGDFGPALLVLGKVRARHVVHGGAVWVIEGDVLASGIVVGHYNHGQMHVGGRLAAALLLSNDHHLAVIGDCAAIDGDTALQERHLVPEVLDYRNDDLQICEYALLDRLVAGQPVLRDADAPPTVLEAGVRGDLTMLRAAIAADRHIDARGVDGMTALMMSADQGQPAMVEALLAAGAQVDLENIEGRTALHFAAMANDAASVSHLLSAGACIEHVNQRALNALQVALSGNRGEAARALLDAGARVDWPRRTARDMLKRCFNAPYSGNGDIDEGLILALLDAGLDVGLKEAPWSEPVFAAAEDASSPLLARLLAPMPKPPTYREETLTLTPLHGAAMSARVDNLALLLSQSWADEVIQGKDNGLLLGLALQGRPLREQLAERRDSSPRPFRAGPVSDERLAALDLLLTAGVPATAMLRGVPVAALSADIRVATRLLAAGASANALNDGGESLLFLVLCHAPADVDVALAKILLDHGADPFAPAPGHGSHDVLHAAAAGGDLDMLDAFVTALLQRDPAARRQIPALLDIALQARERNRDMIVFEAMLQHARTQSLAPFHELIHCRPRLKGDDHHLDSDRHALADAMRTMLSKWPRLQLIADETRQSLMTQRADDERILAVMRERSA